MIQKQCSMKLSRQIVNKPLLRLRSSSLYESYIIILCMIRINAKGKLASIHNDQ